MLRARLPDGRQSSPEPVPGHEIVLKLIVPPPEPAATALQPIPGTGCDECCCTICRPVWETCVCNGVQYGTCWSVCEMRCSPVDCDCYCCPPCDCGCFSEDGPCDYNCAANRMPPNTGTAKLNLSVPKNAVVFINGKQTVSTGATRSYLSQGLTDGAAYKYTVRVLVWRDGKLIEDARQVILHAGEKRNVAFSNASHDL